MYITYELNRILQSSHTLILLYKERMVLLYMVRINKNTFKTEIILNLSRFSRNKNNFKKPKISPVNGYQIINVYKTIKLKRKTSPIDSEPFGWWVSSMLFHGTLVQSLLVSAYSSLRVLGLFTSVFRCLSDSSCF